MIKRHAFTPDTIILRDASFVPCSTDDCTPLFGPQGYGVGLPLMGEYSLAVPEAKHKCRYCTGNTFDDARGNCAACGAPRD